jgi:hypothetical protein
MGDLRLDAETALAAGELIGLAAAHKPERLQSAAKALKRFRRAEPFWS